jgi:hypothetical protein
MRTLSIALLCLAALIDVSRASEVPPKSERHAINSDVLNKKLLPDVRHLLKEKSDGNRQRFLHLLSSLEVDGYKLVNGKRALCVFDTHS